MVDYNPKQAFGNVLREMRQNQKLTLGNVARKLGFSSVYLSDIERNRRNPPAINKVKQISSLLQDHEGKLVDIANRQKNHVELELDGRGKNAQNAALTLARSWDNITEETAEKIINIIQERDDSS